MLSFTLQIIDLKRDPYGTLDKRGKPTIKTFGNVPKNPLQTMEDKLRIANKVNKKYKELMNELDENIKQVMEDIGNDEEAANLLLAKGPTQPPPEKSKHKQQTPARRCHFAPPRSPYFKGFLGERIGNEELNLSFILSWLVQNAS